MRLVAEAGTRGFCARRFASSVEPLRGRPEMKQYFLRVIFVERSIPRRDPPRPARDGPRIDGILPGAPARVNTPFRLLASRRQRHVSPARYSLACCFTERESCSK